MVDAKSYEEYREQVNTKFRLLNTEPAVELVLTEVTERKSNPSQEYFSLLFLGTNEFFLPQHIYRVRHDELGEGDLFLVPVGRDENGFRYEAVFNRLNKEGEKSDAVESGD